MKDPSPNMSDVGRLYQRLLNTAIDRKQALEVLGECIQLVESASHSSNIATDQLDVICGKAFNWGITLMDLGHPSQAEQFIAKSISLLSHTSPKFSELWSDHIQETYSSSLTRKTEAQISDIGTIQQI